ncbi:signal transduction histidine kinase [Williamsia limnetica]|uniref:histidine kinase n=1 Tax=Williamsia limnetica TaxID=882452 RepID=A0A318RTZ2_WILLI|nr:histidine kinase [Williamsia limnetica]PYE21129.1 signal transduction histidine kinase [Williamsia limnetica]
MTRVRIDPDRQRDVAIAVAFLVAGIVLYLGDLRYFFGPTALNTALPQWLPLVTLAIACCSQAWRSYRPAVALTGVVAALIIDAFCGPTIAVWIVYSDVVYAVARYGSDRLRRVMLLVNWLIAAIVLTVALTGSGDWRVALLAMVLVAALIASPASYGHAIRQHQIAADSERDRARAVEALAARDQEVAVASERRRLARDLHDVVAGQLSGIALQSAAALETTDDTVRDSVLRSVRSASVEALREMRTMIELLSGPDDLDTAATADLHRMDRLGDAARACGSTVDMRVESTRLSPASAIVAYRIIQQALTNVAAHSPGADVDVTVRQRCSSAAITVSNTVGADVAIPDRTRGHGIENMRVRAASVGGTVDISIVDRRWQVVAELPTPDLRRSGESDHLPGSPS